ncbi:GAF domain-containing protein [Nocardioides euryhalodurans]|uniref:GAF domain-containing protein n=1 Tax=Nocardioides euryhalodurans TaxID=2518370 RepID=A0A4P7GHC3_9ACTN|nr:GAF domain-containing protein [Nocardioides euryhalodurans]QBR91255.1 GAF domain-containing protein [Nocardioides euryhalodurans]
MVQDDGSARGPHLELDELLSQLIERAQGVRAAQNRLRGLLHANRAVVGDLSLSAVLRRIVEAACELVDAPYGALGVIAPDGTGLEEFIHVGMPEDAVASIGHLPEGKGLLGALIDDPRPIRLRDMRDDIRSVGLPAGHPPMRGFLGVPIRVRDEVFGNLYLASLSQANFDAEDEELVVALAATAGVAIENARLYEESRRRQVWLQASADVTRQLLSAESDGALAVIAERVAELATADVVTVVLPQVGGSGLTVAVAVGHKADQLRGLSYAVEGTLSELVLTTGRSAVLEDASDLTGPGQRSVHMSEIVPVGPVMGVPLAGTEGVRGALLVGRLQGRRPFSAADVEMADTFAHHASVALELADGRREAQRMSLFEERARIARDLHDHVIQQLFASGMMVQGVIATLDDTAAAEPLERVVDSIDDAIRQIRTSIFQLRPHRLPGTELRSEVLDVVADVTPSLGHAPHVQFVGPVDALGDEAMTDDVTAVVRELLSNVARHAGADRVDVAVEATGSTLGVTVTDDGVGPGVPSRCSGLSNLRHRAVARGGTFALAAAGPGGGARAVWEVPLP